MQRFRACIAVLVCTLAIAACDSSSPAAPTPAATPAPTPPPAPAPTFSVSGTISETAPTASRRVDGVQVALSGGPSATTAGDGTFTIAGAAAGTYTLTASKTDYETHTMSVTVGSADVTGLRISLPPSPRIVSVEHMGAIAPEDPSCFGTSRPCDVYPTGAHHRGRIEALVLWETDLAELDLELRCDEEVVAESFRKGGTSEELNAEAPGGQACEIHVIGGGEPQNYRLILRYPY